MTLREIVDQRFARLKSAAPRADIALRYEGDRFTAYKDHAERVAELLEGTGLCRMVELSGEEWFDPLYECHIPLASLDRAISMLLPHMSVSLVDTITERGVPHMVPFLFLKSTKPQPFPEDKLRTIEIETLGDVDPLEGFW